MIFAIGDTMIWVVGINLKVALQGRFYRCDLGLGKEDRASSPPWLTLYKKSGVKPHDFNPKMRLNI
jgi:hypothetical protein